MRGLYLSFTSLCFLFPVGGGSKKFEDWGWQDKILGLGVGLLIWGVFLLGGQYLITWQILLPLPLSHSHHLFSLQYSVLVQSFCSDKVFSCFFSFIHLHILNLAFVSSHFEFLSLSFLNLYNIECQLNIIVKVIKLTLACKFHFIFCFYLLNPCNFNFSKFVIG